MLLVNATNLYIGGGVQVGVSVIEEFSIMKIDFISAVSPTVFHQLSFYARQYCVVINKTPSGLFNFSTRRQLDNLVNKHNISDVFTVFGPSYWNPEVKNHLVGFAVPWLIYDASPILNILSTKERVKKYILQFLQPFFFKYYASKIVTETRDVRLQVIQILNYPPESVFTVSNTIASVFKNPSNYDFNAVKKLPVKNNDIWLLTIAYNYPHKNLKIIAPLLELLPPDFKFILTVDNKFKNFIPERHHDRLITIDSISSAECPPVYKVCDALFLPTLLECFSASYAEAMYMGKPIFTSDRGFARTICQDAAYYFDPLNAKHIADTILQAFRTPVLLKKKCLLGKKIVSELPSAKKRAEQYLSVIYGKRC